MRIDQPLCSFKACRHCFDGNCTAIRTNRERCEFLQYYEAEQDGRLVVLPCRVGDTVYEADFGNGFNEPAIRERTIRGFKHTAYTNYPFCDIEFFGKTVFLTREEATAALQRDNTELD